MANTPKEPPKNFIDALNEQETAKQKQQSKVDARTAHAQNAQAIVDTIANATKALITFQKNHQPTISVQTPDIQGVIKALEAVKKEVANNKPNNTKVVAGLNKLASAVSKLPTTFPEPVAVEEVTVKNQPDYTPEFEKLNNTLKSIDTKPVVTIPKNDYSSIVKPLNDVIAAVNNIKIPEVPETDLSPLLEATNSVQNAITSLRFPVPNYILPYQTSDGKDTQVVLNPDGSLPITATISTGALATAANQTNASQKTQIVDGSGNVIGATVNALDVNIKSGSSAGTQYAELATTSPGTGTLAVGRYKATPPSLTDGQLYGLQLDTSGNLKVSGSLSVGGTTDNSAFTAGTSTGTPSMGFYHSTIDTVTDGRAAALAIDSKRNLLNVIRDAAGNARGANVTAANELLVSVNNASLAVTGTFWQATQPVSGTVTANAGTNLNTSALALETGGNLASIKTDVDNLNLAQASTTLGQKGNLVLGAVTTAAPAYTTAQSNPLSLTTAGALRVDASGTTVPVSGTFWQATQPVSLATNTPTLQSGSTTAVTQATGTNLHMVVDSGTVTNLSQLGGAAIAMGTGLRTAGTQRVTIATDDSVPVTGTFWQATQPVSGTVTTSPPSNASSNISQINGVTPLMGNGVTGTGSLRVTVASDNTAFAVNSTLSAETTKVIGTVNVAAAQTIAVTNAGTFATQSTLAAETTKVIGTVRNGDGAGNLFTSNSTTYTAKFAQDANLLGTLGTAFSTAGKVDVKGADGDVFVRQATGTNLHTVIDSGTITTVSTLTGTTTLTPGTGATNLGKAEDQASVDGDVGVGTLLIRKAAPANTSGTDGDYEFGQMNAGRQWVWAQPNIVTISTTITRPADTTAYAANDAFANSTSAPTTGGFTFTGAALVSGGTGVIKDCVVSASAGTNYSGEIWIFDQAVTATNDNAALSVSDADIQNLVGVIPFQTSDVNAANSISYVTGLNIGYTCIGTANLRFLVKIMSAVTPGNAEVLAIRVKVAN